MKRNFIVCILLSLICFMYSNEIISNNVMTNEQNIMLLGKKINTSINSIFCGSSLLGISSVPITLFSGLCVMQSLEIVDTDAITVIGETMIGISFLTMIAAGIAASVAGYRYYTNNKKTVLSDENHLAMSQSFFIKKRKNFNKIVIGTSVCTGVSAAITITGVFFTAFGTTELVSFPQNHNDALYYNGDRIVHIMNANYRLDYSIITGIFLDIIGGLGLLVCLPMMIASLAMSAWCKGELAKLSPDISLTHDDKKGYTEGYGVSVGMRVRI